MASTVYGTITSPTFWTDEMLEKWHEALDELNTKYTDVEEYVNPKV